MALFECSDAIRAAADEAVRFAGYNRYVIKCYPKKPLIHQIFHIGVPHTAFPLPPQPGADRPGLRESIEVRVIAYFDGATSKKKASM